MTAGTSSEERGTTLRGRLARIGATDPAAAVVALTDPVLAGLTDETIEDLSLAPDVDLVLSTLLRASELADADGRRALADFVVGLHEDETLRRRAFLVLGTSEALGEHLVRHPQDWTALVPREDDVDVHAALQRVVSDTGDDSEPGDRLRREYRRLITSIAAADLTGDAPIEDTMAALSELADATLDAAYTLACRQDPDAAAACRFAIVSMGKCGGCELNYVSDVDVLFVVEPAEGATAGEENLALAAGTRLARSVLRICGAHSAEGSIWPVDTGLRPEGKDGALVRTLASYGAYYQRWASPWEFQALLKARASAGDLELGKSFVHQVLPFVWSAADREGFVEYVRGMRRRVLDNLPTGDEDRQLKLGRGGLRDVEFAVQLLQLVHGRSDVTLRSSTTLLALEALATWGYVGREDAATMASAYRFLRTLEHRIQLHRLRRSHVVPDDPADLRRIARSMGYRTDPVEELEAQRRRHSGQVRRLHEKLFFRPLLDAVAGLDAGHARLTPEAAVERLSALGYADPQEALRHLQALTSGVTRRAAIQRTLLPVMLGWFAESPDPDGGLLAFRRVSDALGSTPWFLRLLRDESVAAERLAQVLASSRYAADLLLRAPEGVRLFADADELVPRSREELLTEAAATVARHEDAQAAAVAVRALRRRELFRTAVAEILGTASIDDTAQALSYLTDATIAGALAAATRTVAGPDGLPTRFAVIAMGRYGGSEVGFASDADVVFVHDPLPEAGEEEAARAALAVAKEMRRLLALPSPDPPLRIDADLRPEGTSGPLVRTLSSYAAYYARWSEPWEAQALLRADPVAGDDALGREFVAMIDPIRYPEAGLDEAALRQIRRLKARMEAERLPRGADPTLHLKLGRGGLSDVEWVAQLLTLQHAARERGLRTPRTVPALLAACDAGLLSGEDTETLVSAWRLASRIRDAVVLVQGRPGDMVPTDALVLAGVSRLLGYAAGRSGDLVQDYLRTARHARSVVERVFYD